MINFKNIWMILLLLLNLFDYSFSNQLHFDGYLLNLGLINLKSNPYMLRGSNKFQNVNRLRLRPKIKFDDNLSFTIEHETDFFFKNGNEYFLDGYKQNKHQVLDLNFIIFNNEIWHIKHFIDRLFFKYDKDKISLTLGKQRIAWGTGRIWNPTDLFNPIHPTNFAKIEKDGVDAVNLKYNISSLSDFSLVINATKNKTNSALRFRTNFMEFDFSLISGMFQNKFLFGADFAGNLYNAGIRGEILIEKQKVKYICGLDYQFSPKLYSLIEYHYNGAGKNTVESYNFYDLFELNTIYLAKNYIVLQINYIVHPLSTISIITNNNLNDRSGYVLINMYYSILDNLNLNWIINIFHGRPKTEFWYYQSSLMIRTEYYF